MFKLLSKNINRHRQFWTINTGTKIGYIESIEKGGILFNNDYFIFRQQNSQNIIKCHINYNSNLTIDNLTNYMNNKTNVTITSSTQLISNPINADILTSLIVNDIKPIEINTINRIKPVLNSYPSYIIEC